MSLETNEVLQYDSDSDEEGEFLLSYDQYPDPLIRQELNIDERYNLFFSTRNFVNINDFVLTDGRDTNTHRFLDRMACGPINIIKPITHIRSFRPWPYYLLDTHMINPSRQMILIVAYKLPASSSPTDENNIHVKTRAVEFFNGGASHYYTPCVCKRSNTLDMHYQYFRLSTNYDMEDLRIKTRLPINTKVYITIPLFREGAALTDGFNIDDDDEYFTSTFNASYSSY